LFSVKKLLKLLWDRTTYLVKTAEHMVDVEKKTRD